MVALLSIYAMAFVFTPVDFAVSSPSNNTIVNETIQFSFNTSSPYNLSANITNSTGNIVARLSFRNDSSAEHTTYNSNGTYATYVFNWTTNNGTFPDGIYNITVGWANISNVSPT